MIRMLIVGYVFAIRSERRRCAEVQLNLACRWFCKFGIEDNIPDHSVFCRARHERFRDSDVLRRVFEGVVAMCIAAGLVGGEAFSVDASLIKADVDKKKQVPDDQPIAWPKAEQTSHAVREYLAALDTSGARRSPQSEERRPYRSPLSFSRIGACVANRPRFSKKRRHCFDCAPPPGSRSGIAAPGFRAWRQRALSCAAGLCVIAGLSLLPASAVGQTAISQGPAPSIGPSGIVQSADANAGSAGTVVGTVTGIVPIDASTLYIGTVNGGVWKTTDGGTTWTPLTNNQASLSIAGLSLDPTDPTHQTLVAGIGQTSNGVIGFDRRGGLQYGLLYTQNGGATWQTFNSFSGQSVIDALARGQTILAATYDPNAPASATGGLYRSVNGGTNFSPVTALPAVPVTSLVGDPSSMTTMYAVTTSPNKDPTQVGIYQSINDGANWKAVFTANTPVTGGTNIIAASSNQLIGTLATGRGGAIAVGFVDQTTKQPVALYLSQNQGQAWTALKLPTPPEGGGINPGKQAFTDFTVAIDPNNKNIVYVAGDRQQGTGLGGGTFPNSIGAATYTLQAWRIQLNADNTSTATPITDNYAANNSTAHADSRAMAFDAAGDLLISTDAGLYLRTQPQSSSGGWQGLNGNLSVFQTYSIAYDANSKRVIVAGQDTGAAIQGMPGAAANYSAVQAGDGTMTAVNDKWAGNRSAIYTSSQGLGGGGG